MSPYGANQMYNYGYNHYSMPISQSLDFQNENSVYKNVESRTRQ